MMKSKNHYDGVGDSLELLKKDIVASLSNVLSIIIKINLVITKTPAYSQGVELATTPLQAVKSFIDFILPFYSGKIIIVEESAWGNTDEGFKMYGFKKIAEDNLQVELFNLEKDKTMVRTIRYPGAEIELPFSKTMLGAPFLVSIARPKTHCSVVMTAGIKNVLVGAIQKYSMRRKIHRDSIYSIIASIADLVYPNLVIIDGTIGMEDGGPVRGKAINSGWVMSSFDALAADSLGAYIMGFNIDNIQYLTLLREKK
jgi:uncharacterized protein (DUF362 family)